MADEMKTDETVMAQTVGELEQDRSMVGSLAVDVSVGGGEFPMRLVVYFADPTKEAIAIPLRAEEATSLAEVMLGAVDLLKDTPNGTTH